MPGVDKVIGARLRARREVMGYAAEDFAQYLGVTAAELRDIEAGNLRLGPDLMAKAAEALDVLTVYFFAEDDAGEDGNDQDDDAGPLVPPRRH